jgi:hypothetical protein
VLELVLNLSLLLAPPEEDAAARTEPADATESTEPADPTEPAEPAANEFGELEADPNAEVDPTDSSSGGYGTLAPLPTYTERPEPVEPRKPLIIDEPAETETEGFREPEDYGPFYEREPVSEVQFPADAHRRNRKVPFASVSGGAFCFVEDSACGAALIADADVGVGLNVITTDRGFDVPYTQLRVRGGLTVRPIILAKRRWHAWGVGVVGSWSIASGSITATNQDPEDPNVGITETKPIQTYRVGLINQLWLSQKRHALHVDFTFGAANSSVLNYPGRYWGTTAEVALGFGGWGGLYLSGDFLDGDTRMVLGLRGHAIATGPMIALVILGLVAGGVAL